MIEHHLRTKSGYIQYTQKLPAALFARTENQNALGINFKPSQAAIK